MTDQEKVRVQQEFIALASYYGRNPYTDMALKMIADDLRDLRLDQVLNSIKVYKQNAKNRTPPFPAQLREIISPVVSDKDEATLLAARIIKCIASHGYTWSQGGYIGGVFKWSGKGGKLYDNFSDAIRSEIGEVGEYVVRLFGGFSALCERCGDQPGILQAQLRDITTSVLLKSKNGTLEESLKLPGSTASQEIAAKVKALTVSAVKDLE